ncbi:MAG: hypothetical protein LC789_01855 [Actinobacteria bacterium]|nr:hypothetical protein [Actinomycetota bacterium]MCA1721182.1 hypothetical protein [Actinomycetota bacterium]
MAYEAVFFPTLPEGTSVHDHYDAGRFRATVELKTGQYAGIAFAPMDTPMQTRSASPCPPGDPNCDPAVLTQIVGYISRYRPADVILFALAHIRPGSLRRWAGSVAETSGQRGVKVAAAYVHGIRGANVLIELVGDDRADADELLLDLLDRDEVRDFQVMHATADDVRGFGGEDRTQEGAALA